MSLTASNAPFVCRSCGHSDCLLVIDLGQQPLANNYPAAATAVETEARFPLRLVVCQGCWLMQVEEAVPPELIFPNYAYFSSFSSTMLAHAAQAAADHSRKLALGPHSFVVEVASNDGYLLKNFVAAGIPCLGVEPAQNVAEVARQAGIETETVFFGVETARQIKETRRAADLILGNNVFAHVPRINDFIGGLKELLTPGGTIVLEFPHGCKLIAENEFDTIYHEHVFYFTLTPLEPAFRRHGLEITRVEELAIHGGSLRLFVSHAGQEPVHESVPALLQQEERLGVKTAAYYQSLQTNAQKIRQDLLSLLKRIETAGSSVAAYGASAKGSTLLNFCGITAQQISFVTDRSSYKQGRLTPGSHIPIVPPERLVESRPDYCLLLVWNFAEEILQQQAAYRAAGGRFIIPVPAVHVLAPGQAAASFAMVAKVVSWQVPELIGSHEADSFPPFLRTYNQDGLTSMHNTAFAFETRFVAAYAKARSAGSWHGAELHWRMHVLTWAAAQALFLEGDFVECGTNRGGSALMLLEYHAEALRERRFHLFDSFKGLDPALSSAKELAHFEGLYPECYEDVKALFADRPHVRLVRGSIPESLPGQPITQVAFMHVDLNAAVPERAALEHFWPLLVPHGVVVFDDYGWVACAKQKETLDEFAAQRGVSILTLPTGQGLLIKPAASNRPASRWSRWLARFR